MIFYSAFPIWTAPREFFRMGNRSTSKCRRAGQRLQIRFAPTVPRRAAGEKFAGVKRRQRILPQQPRVRGDEAVKVFDPRRLAPRGAYQPQPRARDGVMVLLRMAEAGGEAADAEGNLVFS